MPTETYSAARYARDAAAAIARHHARAAGCRSSSAARASTTARSCAACFPGRRATTRCARGSTRVADRRGVESLHRWLARVDPASARAHPAARPQAARPRARGLSADRPAADRALRARRRRRSPGYDVLTIGVTLPRAGAARRAWRAACRRAVRARRGRRGRGACSPPACRRRRTPSAASSTARRRDPAAACATRPPRARSSSARTCATRGAS